MLSQIPSTGENIGSIHERLLEIITNVVPLQVKQLASEFFTILPLHHFVDIAKLLGMHSGIGFSSPRGNGITPSHVVPRSLWFLSLLVDLHLIRVLADPRDKVLLDLVAPPTRNAKNQIVEGRPSQNIHVITCLTMLLEHRWS